uniref:ELMO domain-containing protein n=1 Tax=Panagrellus redivivus TaxID=6233 RepID=A0A7E4VWL1_PANRE
MSAVPESETILNLKLVDLKRSVNDTRGGFVIDPKMGEYLPPGIPIPPAQPVLPHITFGKTTATLDTLLMSMAKQLGLPVDGHHQYGFMYDTSVKTGVGAEKKYVFVTQEALPTFKDGFVWILSASPTNYAITMLTKLEKINLFGDWGHTLEALSNLSRDPVFVREFHAKGGILKVSNLIESGVFDSNLSALCVIFNIFLQLMQHPGFVAWSDLNPNFVLKLVGYIDGSGKFENADSLRLALSLLLTIMDKGEHLVETVQQTMKFESLIRLLDKRDERYLIFVLKLMNQLYEKAKEEDRLAILELQHDKPFRSAVENVIKSELNKPDERVHEQLLQIQDIFFRKLRELAMRVPSVAEIDSITDMKEWQCTSPRSSAASVESHGTSERAISLDNESLLAMGPSAKSDFADLVRLTPPGSLALDTILDYTKRFTKRLNEIQIESSIRPTAWPTIMSHLVTSLIRILSIMPSEATPTSEDPSITHSLPEQILRPWLIMFNSEHPFHDLFAVAIDTYFRTWREMHAGSDDEGKVLHVVRHQLAYAVRENLPTCAAFDDYVQRKLSYFHIQKIWERQRIEREELELNSLAVRELQKHLRPSVVKLVNSRRINALKKGYCFTKIAKSKSAKPYLWFWKLDEKERELSCCDCFEDTTRPNYKTKQTILINDIRRIITGTEYSEVVIQQIGTKFLKKTSSALPKYGFSIEPKDQTELLILATDDEAVHQAWTEGLNILLGREVIAERKAYENEIDKLLDMEIRVRLLNVGNPPSTVPRVPPLPSNFDWIPGRKAVIS